MSLRKPLVAIIGPTASGKSSLALELAECYNGEIICADSRTVYRGMDIGTAKPSKEDQLQVPHHLLDIIAPDQAYNVGAFKEQANKLIDEITSRGHLPIMVGGTGLYIDSVIYDYAFNLEVAEKDEQNPRHLKQSDTLREEAELRGNTLVIGIQVEQEELENRIRMKIEKMVQDGLENEVKRLVDQYGWEIESMTGVGYKEWQTYFAGAQTLEETKELITIHTRQYAKRQRSWFKRNKHINWVSDLGSVHEIVKQFLQQNK